MQTKRFMLAIATPVVLGACGLGQGAGQGTGQQGYLAEPDSNSVQFLQVTRSGSSLTGTLQSAGIAATDSTTVTTFNDAFTGTVDGSQNLTLTFPQGFGFTSALSGRYNGSDIQLSVPQTDGTLATEDFAPSDTTAYNSAVNALQQKAAQALADQQAAAAAQQQAQQDAQARAVVDQAISVVKGDFTSLASDIGSYKSLYASLSTDVQQTYKDTNVTYADLKIVQNEGASSSTCSSDAYSVGSDAYTVGSDEYTIESDQYSEQADVQTVNGDISNLNADFQKMQAAEAAIPSYQPGSVPTAGQVSKARTQAKSANSQANAKIATALKQAAGWITQANQYAADATAVCG